MVVAAVRRQAQKYLGQGNSEGTLTSNSTLSPDAAFSRGALFWRCWYATEDALSRLPMLILIPTLGAIIGTAWGVSHPPQTVDAGLVVAQQSFWGVLVAALIGGVAATIVLVLLISVTLYVRYLYFGGDAGWTGVYGGAVQDLLAFELQCKAAHPIHPDTLGAMSCVLKPPGGPCLSPDRSGLRINPMGCIFHFALGQGPATTRRWYAMRGKARLQEVARYKGPADSNATPMTLVPSSSST